MATINKLLRSNPFRLRNLTNIFPLNVFNNNQTVAINLFRNITSTNTLFDGWKFDFFLNLNLLFLIVF